MSQDLDVESIAAAASHATGLPEASRAPYEVRLLDDDPELMEQSYRLRYQVYCIERRFLPAANYPDQRESDAFDTVSRHVGAVDADGVLVATARLVLPNFAGLPLFQHCTLFPHDRTITAPRTVILEVSRVSISRQSARGRHDTIDRRRDTPQLACAPVAAGTPRVPRRSEPFLTLLKAIIYGAKRAGATHLIGATDAALHRRLVQYGFPYRVVGPEVDYYGTIAPHLMNLAEFDQVVLSGKFAALEGFPVTLGGGQWQRSHGIAHTAGAGAGERHR